MSKESGIRYYSGYIRNYKALCRELSISEDLSREEREEKILLAGLERWGGLHLAEHLYGMFAIAIYDGANEKLYVIRDQVGQKQMFYTVANGELLCDGDIDKIANDSRYEKKFNHTMLQHYLFYGYPIGKETFYEGIHKLPAGHLIEWDGKEANVIRYYHLTFTPDHTKDGDAWAKEIQEVIEEILSEEREDDKLPYKESFLSGGVDSSYLLAASDSACANTVGYEESGFDESDLAKKTAEVLGKGFRKKLITPEDYFARIPTVIDKLGQPLGDASAVAFSIGCEAVKEHADVVYSGEGIDEFFGGYNAHQRKLGEDWTYLTCSHIMQEEVVRSLLNDYDESVEPKTPITPLWEEVQDEEELSKKLIIDISLWLEGDIYLNTDRTSTACGIELHTPFSDLRLLEVAARIPEEWKFAEGQNKYAFRKAASAKLPDEVAFRKKVGFPVPVRKWLADSKYNGPMLEKLKGETSKKFFRQDVLQKMVEDYLGGEEALWGRIYAIYVFLLWYDLKF